MNSKICLLKLVQAALEDNIVSKTELQSLCNRVPAQTPMEQMAPAGNSPGLSDQYRGTIKSFNPKEGYGFIACPELKKQYGSDVFMHQHQFYKCPVQLRVGDSIVFRLEISKQGKPQARDINKDSNF